MSHESCILRVPCSESPLPSNCYCLYSLGLGLVNLNFQELPGPSKFPWPLRLDLLLPESCECQPSPRRECSNLKEIAIQQEVVPWSLLQDAPRGERSRDELFPLSLAFLYLPKERMESSLLLEAAVAWLILMKQ